jgi:DNA-directed RNA polymerase specialized sigma24 family protein
MTNVEIGRVLEMTSGAVGTLIYRALKTVKSSAQKEGAAS